MSNGPRATIAEVVTNTLPRDRTRLTMHHEPQYYPIRNHLMDFLVTRSGAVQRSRGEPPAGEHTPPPRLQRVA